MDASMYPPIDYTPLLVPGEDIVVRCDTEDEAKHLVARMLCDYPERCGVWSLDDVHFAKYDTVCYRPNINTPDLSFRYGSLSHYQLNGFTVIRFSDLLIQADIEESEKPISFLLEG